MKTLQLFLMTFFKLSPALFTHIANFFVFLVCVFILTFSIYQFYMVLVDQLLNINVNVATLTFETFVFCLFVIVVRLSQV